MATTSTVVLLPVWGAGHLSPMLEAGRRLLACRSGDRALSLTVLVMRPPSEPQASKVERHIRREQEAAARHGYVVRFHRLPAVEPPTDHQGPVEFTSRVVRLNVPHVRAAVSGLQSPVAAILLDLFCTEVIDVSRELAVPAYLYFTCNAAALSFFLRLPALCEEVDGEFGEMEGAVDLPGLPPVPPSSLPLIIMDRTKPCCDWYAYHGRRFMDADGIVVNTAAELEPRVLAAVTDGRQPAAAEAEEHHGRRRLRVEPPHALVRLSMTRWWAEGDHGANGVELRQLRVLHRATGARGGPRPGTQRAPVPLGAARRAAGRRAAAQRRQPRGAAPGGFPRPDQGEGPRVADDGAAEGDPRPRRRGRVRNALRLELDHREPVVRRADGAVAALRRAAPERVRAGGRRGRRRGDGDGPEEGQLRGRGGAGARGEGAHGWWRGGEEGEGEGRGDEGGVQEGCRGRRVVSGDVEEALR